MYRMLINLSGMTEWRIMTVTTTNEYTVITRITVQFIEEIPSNIGRLCIFDCTAEERMSLHPASIIVATNCIQITQREKIRSSLPLVGWLTAPFRSNVSTTTARQKKGRPKMWTKQTYKRQKRLHVYKNLSRVVRIAFCFLWSVVGTLCNIVRPSDRGFRLIIERRISHDDDEKRFQRLTVLFSCRSALHPPLPARSGATTWGLI